MSQAGLVAQAGAQQVTLRQGREPAGGRRGPAPRPASPRPHAPRLCSGGGAGGEGGEGSSLGANFPSLRSLLSGDAHPVGVRAP